MRKPLSVGLCLEILNFVLQRKTVRVPEIQMKFNLSYHKTQLIVGVLERYGIIGPKNSNGREVRAPFIVNGKQLQSVVDHNWADQLLQGINLN